MPRRTIDLDDELDRWRYRCPHDHASWEATNDHFWCDGCRHLGLDHEQCRYEVLVDQQTMERIPREQIEIVRSPDDGKDAPQLEGRA